MDTCFSGRSSNGKQLVPGLQGVPIARRARAAAKVAVFSAAASDEYAGPLPGAQRPAFSYLALGGLYGWGDLDRDGSVLSGELQEFLTSTFRRAVPSQTPMLLASTSVYEVAPSLREPAPPLDEILASVELRKTPLVLVADAGAAGIADALERLLRGQGLAVIRASGGDAPGQPVVTLSAIQKEAASDGLLRAGVTLSVKVVRDGSVLSDFKRNATGSSTRSPQAALAAAEARIVEEIEDEDLPRLLGLQ
jgi:hypothetical protein